VPVVQENLRQEDAMNQMTPEVKDQELARLQRLNQAQRLALHTLRNRLADKERVERLRAEANA